MDKLDRNKVLESMDKKRALFGLLFALDNRLQTAGDTFYKEITVKQFFLLICLFLFPEEPPTISQLSEVMGSSHQNIKQIVNKLEKIGYIKTYRDKQDKRKLRVATTEKMSVLSDKYRDKENEFLDKFYEGISDDEIMATFKTVLKIENNLIGIRNEYK